MNELDKHLSLWNLTNPVLLAQTATSHVYRVESASGPAALKLLTPEGARDESCAPTALKYFDGAGSVRVLNHTSEAHLLEFVSGPSLLEYVNEGKEAEAVSVLCGILKQIHAIKKPLPSGLIPLERRFKSLTEYSGALKLLKDAAAVACELLAQPDPAHVLHGDLHHENVLKHSERGWLAIDPKGLVGERGFDAANIVFNPMNLPHKVKAGIARTCDQICDELLLDRARFLRFAFAYGALSASWSLHAGDSAELAVFVCEELRKRL